MALIEQGDGAPSPVATFFSGKGAGASCFFQCHRRPPFNRHAVMGWAVEGTQTACSLSNAPAPSNTCARQGHLYWSAEKTPGIRTD